MRKKMLVGAVAAAVSVPGLALAATNFGSGDNVVELYGKVYPEVVIPHGSGATDAGATVATFAGTPTGENSVIRRTEMESSNTRFGIRGHEKLGPNLSAIFQLETAFHVDSNDSKFAQRNSFVGLSGKTWGTVKVGRMDTPFKKYGDELSFLGVSSGNFVSTSSVLRKTGYGTNSAMSFHLRRQNAVQYDSPNVAGLHAAVQYSTNEADTGHLKPHVWSGGVEWARGPVKVALGYEEHWDLFGGSKGAPKSMSNASDPNVNSKDKAWEAMVLYKLGHHTFEADYNEKKYDENASVTGRFLSYKNSAYALKWEAKWSKAFRTEIAYVKAMKGSCSRVNATCSTDGLDGSLLNLGLAYYFSPRTYVFVLGSILKNGFSSRYNNEELQDPSVGEDITQWAVGLSHSF